MYTSTSKSIYINIFLGLLMAGSLTANAGLLDDLASDANNLLRGTANDVAREQTRKADDDAQQDDESTKSTQPPAVTRTPAVTSTPVAEQQPQYDRKLVADIQENLNRLGYSAGTVDGLFGAGTRHAAEQYQYDRGLLVDGAPPHICW